jgi:hypothetical protein
MLIESRQATLLIEFASREKKKHLFSKEKFFFSTFQSHEMKSIDIIFAFNIICFNVYTKSIRILLVFVLVVLVLVIVLAFCLVFVFVFVFCSRLNQFDEQQALLSNSSSHLTKSSSSARVRIARIVVVLNFRTLVLLQ